MDSFLKTFFDWFQKYGVLLNQKGLRFTFSDISESDKPGQYVDMETPQYLARITVWSSGECEAEAINIHSGKRTAYESAVFESISEMEKALPIYVAKLMRIDVSN